MHSRKVSRLHSSSAANRKSFEKSSMTHSSTRTFVILVIFATSASASFFPIFGGGSNSNAQSASNVCIYSADPAKYPPKCFLCALVVYNSALQACVNGSTSMPNNITFSQAKCLESNCAINYPSKPAPTVPTMPPKLEALAEAFFKGGFKGKRSIPDSDRSLDNDIVTNDGKRVVMRESLGDDASGRSKYLLQLDGIKLSEADNVRIVNFVETFASSDFFSPPEPEPELSIEYEEY